MLQKLSTLSLSKLDSQNLETTAVSTSIKVVEIKNSEITASCEASKLKGQLKLECLMCSKKFKDSFMLWSHLLNKH